MNLQEQLLLSSYLIKAAGKSHLGAAIFKALGGNKPKPVFSPAEQAIKNRLANLSPKEQQAYAATQVGRAARKATPAVVPNLAAVAPAAVGPQGLQLARQGIGQIGAGLNQAARAGYGATSNAIRSGLTSARQRLGAGLSAVGRGISSTARNPLVQAGGAGLLGGAAGAYGVNRLMGGVTPAQQTPAAASGNTTPSMGSGGPGNYQAMAAVAPSAVTPAAVAAPAMTDAELDEQGVQMTAPISAPAPSQAPAAPAMDYAAFDEEGMQPTPPAVAANNDNSLRDAFGQYMGSYNANSALDRAKFKYLQDLQSKGLALNAANIYNKSLGYGNWKY